MLLAVVAACVVVSTGTFAYEPDLWQHLAVGRALWTTRSIPHAQVWTWPTYGTPDVLPSWGFRALLWPFWALAGVAGLYFWRWITTLAAFAILCASGRRMGARGATALVAVALCGLAYRSRAQVRPETLVAVLLALEIWILETRRLGGRDHGVWLLAVAVAWANVHLSYYLGFVVLGAYAAESWRRERRVPTRLLALAAGMAVVSLANPFGWRALWQPIDFALHGRKEVIYQDILELRPVDWSTHRTDGLPLVVLGWPLLLLWRARRRGVDLAEVLLCAWFTATGLAVRRFTGFHTLVAVPFLMRDLDAWIAARAWPRWSAPPRVRAAAACAACVLLCAPEWWRAGPPFRTAFPMEQVPVRACDFMAEHGVRGRAFNPFYFGGYLLWRFWPEYQRLPFIDIHQAGTPELRFRYMRAFYRPIGWSELEQRFRFDWVLLDRQQHGADRLLDFVDADARFALVFLDDVGAVYVRREGPLSGVAGRFGYGTLPAAPAGRSAVFQRCLADTSLRRRVVAELEREAAGSSWNRMATSALAALGAR